MSQAETYCTVFEAEETMKPNIKMCGGCLATDRKLTKLGNYTHLFIKLEAAIDQEVQEPLMCWECTSVFHKISKFREQVVKAQFFLRGKHEGGPEYVCLSSLHKSSTKIDYFDIEIVHIKKNRASKEDAFLKLEKIGKFLDQQYEIDINYKKCENDENEAGPSLIESIDDSKIEKHEVDDLNNADNDWKSEKYDDENEGGEDDQPLFDFANNDNTSKKVEAADVVKTNKRLTPRKQIHYRYRVIKQHVIGMKNREKLYKTVKIDKNEATNLLKKELETKSRFKMQIKCEHCVGSFPSEEALRKHNKKYHSKANPKWICGICKKTFPSEAHLIRHNEKHFNKFECTLCGHEARTRQLMYMHLEYVHGKLWECVKCLLRFPSSQRNNFHKHYRDAHMTFICDQCGLKFTTKTLIQNHIKRSHIELICKECNITFTRYETMRNHNMLKHMAPMPSEETYCVECDIQFANKVKYRNHINSSVKHKPAEKKRIVCPECGKVYAKNIYMKNHFNLVHLKQTKHFCTECSRYFLNSFRLRQHTERTHSKIKPVKNKLCPFCGRGFSERRVLTNHIRTHTGERPFSCDYCPAAFAQQTALKTHVKSRHREALM